MIHGKQTFRTSVNGSDSDFSLDAKLMLVTLRVKMKWENVDFRSRTQFDQSKQETERKIVEKFSILGGGVACGLNFCSKRWPTRDKCEWTVFYLDLVALMIEKLQAGFKFDGEIVFTQKSAAQIYAFASQTPSCAQYWYDYSGEPSPRGYDWVSCEKPVKWLFQV